MLNLLNCPIGETAHIRMDNSKDDVNEDIVSRFLPVGTQLSFGAVSGWVSVVWVVLPSSFLS